MLVGLVATYGRPTLLANCLACFEAQDHEARRLLVLDDAGQIEPQHGERWHIDSTAQRYPTLTDKYAAMLRQALDLWPNTTAFLIVDDDDIYSPRHFSAHASALENARWSYPRQVYSLHRPPAKGWDEPGLEESGGRFWASAAVRVDLLAQTGGFLTTPRATFDQEHLAAWHKSGGEPGRPDALAPPSYVYGWTRANHCSALMSSADWYQRHGLMESGKVGRLTPRMDEQTVAIYARLFSEPAAGGRDVPNR